MACTAVAFCGGSGSLPNRSDIRKIVVLPLFRDKWHNAALDALFDIGRTEMTRVGEEFLDLTQRRWQMLNCR